MTGTRRSRPYVSPLKVAGVVLPPNTYEPGDYNRVEFYKKQGPSEGPVSRHREHNHMGEIGYRYVLKLRPGESEDTVKRQFSKQKEKPCPSCFQHLGRMWLLKGGGDKSKLKAKGMRRNKMQWESDFAMLDGRSRNKELKRF
jgi:hypothetical protein